MSSIAFVTGADRGLGLALCSGLLERGWDVFAGQYMLDWVELSSLAAQYPKNLTIIPLDVSAQASVNAALGIVQQAAGVVDLLINNAGVTSPSNFRPLQEAQDYAEMQRLYNVNALGPLRVVEAFLPVISRSTFKRLCFVSSEAGSITSSQRTSWFGYCMSKAALNMAIKNLFNALRPEGYTFRVYHPGWMRSYMGGVKNTQADMEPEEAAAKALPIFLDPLPNEDHLALIDYEGQEWPW